MNKFAMVQQQFRQLNCGKCEAAFTPQGIKLLREENDFYVVRVTCTTCQHPAGVAVVGADYEPVAERAQRANADKAPKAAPAEVPFASADEEARFAALGPITSNDVLDAHGFFSGLGADWARHLKG